MSHSLFTKAGNEPAVPPNETSAGKQRLLTF